MGALNINALLLAALLLTGCATAPPAKNPLAEWSPSDNYDVRLPRLIVIHGTEMASADAALAVLKSRNASGRVSAHYLVTDQGRIIQLVEDSKRAWHAGAGRWHGMNDINSVSIGIELDNDGREPYPKAQIEALIALLSDLSRRYALQPSAVIGHSDMAPARKQDPGILFPWQRLAEAGFGVWYADDLPEPPEDFDPVLALRTFGYDTRDLPAAVTAFKRRFRGTEDRQLDAFDAKILYSLLQQ